MPDDSLARVFAIIAAIHGLDTRRRLYLGV